MMPKRKRKRKSMQHPNYVHGMSGTRVYRIYCGMHSRCYNDKSPGYKSYGGRGIYVLPIWHSFPQFFRDMGEPPEGYSLERIDNAKSYSPDNCRWATKKEQARNRRSNVVVALPAGEQVTLTQACEVLGIRYAAVQARRHKRGMLPEQAIAEVLAKQTA